MGYTNYKSNTPTFSSVNFNNNRLVGKFLFKQGEKYLIEGQFDENGKFAGTWIIKWISKNEAFENIRAYENGELKTMIERNASSGDILYRDSNSEGNGRKIMNNAIFFWLTADETLTVDDIAISERNYMFKFNRGIIKPVSPFEIKDLNKTESTPTINQPNKSNNSEIKSIDNINNSKEKGIANGMPFSLSGRSAISLSTPECKAQAEGTVVVAITVNQDGHVIQADSGVKGSTTFDEELLNASQKAALKSRFDKKPDAPSFQKGTITYRFRIQ
jgi:TonB family protein